MSKDAKYYEQLLEQLEWMQNNPRGIKAFTNKTLRSHQNLTNINIKFAALPMEFWHTASENVDKCLQILRQLSITTSPIEEIKKKIKGIIDYLDTLIKQIDGIPKRELPEPLSRGYSLVDLVRSYLYQLNEISEDLKAPPETEQYYTTTIPKEELFPSSLTGSALYRLSLIFKQIKNPTPTPETKPEEQLNKALEKIEHPSLTEEQKQQANIVFQQLLQEAKNQGITEPAKVMEYVKTNAGKLVKTQYLNKQIRFAQSLSVAQQQYIMQLVDNPSEFAEAFNKTYQTNYTPAQIKQYTTPSIQTPSVTSPTQVPSNLNYTVQQGDTLSGIAKKLRSKIPGLTWQDIYSINSGGKGANLTNPDKIQIGQQLIIPSSSLGAKTPSDYSGNKSNLKTKPSTSTPEQSKQQQTYPQSRSNLPSSTPTTFPEKQQTTPNSRLRDISLIREDIGQQISAFDPDQQKIEKASEEASEVLKNAALAGNPLEYYRILYKLADPKNVASHEYAILKAVKDCGSDILRENYFKKVVKNSFEQLEEDLRWLTNMRIIFRDSERTKDLQNINIMYQTAISQRNAETQGWDREEVLKNTFKK